MDLELFRDCESYDLDYLKIKGNLIRVPSADGFNYGYMLYIPDNIRNEVTMIVEGANVSRTCSTIEEANQLVFRTGRYPDLPIYEVANELGLPVIYPLFPRIFDNSNEQATIYTHMLSTNSLSNETTGLVQNGLERVDLQLIEMFKDARKRLKAMAISVDSKFIIDGFSASAKFANRFTLLHPEYIRMCIGGGVSGALTLPIKKMGGQILKWPVGVGNLEELDIQILSEHLKEFSQVPQFYYYGELDLNDPFVFDEDGEALYKGLINTDELMQLYDVFGSTSMHDRWICAQKLYNDLGVNVDFMTYQQCGHTPTPAYDDVKAKICTVLGFEEKSNKM